MSKITANNSKTLPAPPGQIRGFVDFFSDQTISGWVGGNLPSLTSDVSVELYKKNTLISQTLATLHRSDTPTNEWRKGYFFKVDLTENKILDLFLEGT